MDATKDIGTVHGMRLNVGNIDSRKILWPKLERLLETFDLRVLAGSYEICLLELLFIKSFLLMYSSRWITDRVIEFLEVTPLGFFRLTKGSSIDRNHTRVKNLGATYVNDLEGVPNSQTNALLSIPGP